MYPTSSLKIKSEYRSFSPPLWRLLKDRKGRTLSFDDIKHYQRIVGALAETITLMEQIDEVIDEHVGWPIE
jgi:predicted CopG family antitoxin